MNLQQNIPVLRILNRLDEFFSKNDLAGAGRFLETWLAEATAVREEKAQLLLLNELLGVYRKSGNKEKAFQSADTVLSLTEGDSSVGAATCRINCATVYTAFGEHEKALVLFSQAQKIYEGQPDVPKDKLGSLYNNMAMAALPLGDTAQARELSHKALAVMKTVPASMPEQAITWLNMANIAEAEKGPEQGWEEIEQCLSRANQLLEDPENIPNSAYAFACSKCAPVFDYYGYFFYAAKLQERSREIYARS